MKHEEFENQMFAHVNKNCQMKELNRQEIERIAMEEEKHIRNCKKANAVIGIIVWTMCFTTLLFAVWAFNYLGHIRTEFAIAVMAVVGYVVGMNVNALFNRIKK